MYKIQPYNHEAKLALTDVLEAAVNRAKECTKNGGVCLVYDEDTLIGIGEKGMFHEIKNGNEIPT